MDGLEHARLEIDQLRRALSAAQKQAEKSASLAERAQRSAWEAIAQKQRMQTERDEAREIVAKVNNSFGSYSYHINPHPAEMVEAIKEQSRVYWADLERAIASIKRLTRERDDASQAYRDERADHDENRKDLLASLADQDVIIADLREDVSRSREFSGALLLGTDRDLIEQCARVADWWAERSDGDDVAFKAARAVATDIRALAASPPVQAAGTGEVP